MSWGGLLHGPRLPLPGGRILVAGGYETGILLCWGEPRTQPSAVAIRKKGTKIAVSLVVCVTMRDTKHHSAMGRHE